MKNQFQSKPYLQLEKMKEKDRLQFCFSKNVTQTVKQTVKHAIEK